MDVEQAMALLMRMPQQGDDLTAQLAQLAQLAQSMPQQQQQQAEPQSAAAPSSVTESNKRRQHASDSEPASKRMAHEPLAPTAPAIPGWPEGLPLPLADANTALALTGAAAGGGGQQGGPLPNFLGMGPGDLGGGMSLQHLQALAALMPMGGMDGMDSGRKPAGRNAQPSRPWTETEEHTFINALDIYGRDWKGISSMVITRDPRQCSSHAQKHFIKLCLAGKPMPLKVRASGEGYTLSGKPLDPTSAAAIAYGFRPHLLLKLTAEELAQAKSGIIVANLPRSLGGLVDDNEANARGPKPKSHAGYNRQHVGMGMPTEPGAALAAAVAAAAVAAAMGAAGSAGGSNALANLLGGANNPFAALMGLAGLGGGSQQGLLGAPPSSLLPSPGSHTNMAGLLPTPAAPLQPAPPQSDYSSAGGIPDITALLNSLAQGTAPPGNGLSMQATSNANSAANLASLLASLAGGGGMSSDVEAAVAAATAAAGDSDGINPLLAHLTGAASGSDPLAALGLALRPEAAGVTAASDSAVDALPVEQHQTWQLPAPEG